MSSLSSFLYVIAVIAVITSTVLFSTEAAVSSDEILSFPGYNQPLPSKQYGGYLDAENGNAHLFYMFVESEGNPSTDPIILWLNGGPGCSSLLGYFTEHGPFDPSSGTTVSLRPYRWSRLANILYLESPAGVGFGYCDDGNYNYNDTRSMNMNYDALTSFFNSYPEYKTNPFYIMGESYAGIYVPMLANKIVENAATFNGPKLVGVGVGNGCTGTDAKSTCSGGLYCSGPNCPEPDVSQVMPGSCYAIQLRTQYLAAVPAAPEELRQAVEQTCNWNALVPNITDLCGLSINCFENINAMNSYFLAIDFYNVYGTCVNPNMTTPGTTSCIQQGSAITNSVSQSAALMQGLVAIERQQTNTAQQHLSQLLTIVDNTRKVRSLSAAGSPPSVYDDDTGATFDSDYWQGLGAPAFCFSQTPYVSEYINSDAFINAVHAQRQPFCWGGCNDAETFTYTRTLAQTDDIYTNLMNKDVYVLIYNGDFDGVVPYNDNYGWTTSLAQSLNLPVAKNYSAWRYTSDADNSTQNGGFSVKWSVPSSTPVNGFEFRTVRAAGHTVPQDTPDKAFQLFAHLIGQGEKHYYFPPTVDSVTSSSSSSSNSLSHGWITSIVLGGVLLVAIIIIILLVTGTIAVGSRGKGHGHNQQDTQSPMQYA